jgi:hypothetical protein
MVKLMYWWQAVLGVHVRQHAMLVLFGMEQRAIFRQHV